MAAGSATPGTLLRLAAFTTDPAGGNPAGVWIGDVLPPDDEMQRIATEVGYSETAFLAPDGPDGSDESGRYQVRYFSPLAEVPFCGHATIAGAVALADRGAGNDLVLRTNDGPVAVTVGPGPDGVPMATLVSVQPWVREPPADLVAETLRLLDWRADELDPTLPPALGYAGVTHLVLAVRELGTLARLDYPFEPMRTLMLAHDLTTLQLIWRETPVRFRARDPFPVGGAVEDPATGAAAAALGAVLRERGVITAPARFEILQGVEMGRPSRLTVSIERGESAIRVSGTAVPI